MKNSIIKQSFNITSFREFIVRLRIFYYVKILRNLKTSDSNEAFPVTVKHNLKSLKNCNSRMDLLIKPIAVIESIKRSSRILIIGPRNENDLFLLLSHGFGWNNLFGLDLISYSPRIFIGDAHHMKYDDNYFDVVICGWTLSYSSTPNIMAKEILRVTRNEGVIAIGVEYSTLTKSDYEKLTGYSIQDFDRLDKRINSVNQIIDLFKPNVKDIFFNHDAPNRISHTAQGYAKSVSNVAVIFNIEK